MDCKSIFLSLSDSPELARCFLVKCSVSGLFMHCFFTLMCVFVLWQYSRFSSVCLRHGGGGPRLHWAFQRAEIPRLHLDAFSWREGSQAKVRTQATRTHTPTRILAHMVNALNTESTLFLSLFSNTALNHASHFFRKLKMTYLINYLHFCYFNGIF